MNHDTKNINFFTILLHTINLYNPQRLLHYIISSPHIGHSASLLISSKHYKHIPLLPWLLSQKL